MGLVTFSFGPQYNDFKECLRFNAGGFKKFNKENVIRRLNQLADGDSINDIFNYEREEAISNGRFYGYDDLKLNPYLALATGVELGFEAEPDSDRCIVIFAGPVCAALILKEYELAERLLEYFPIQKNECIYVYDENQVVWVVRSDDPGEQQPHRILLESYLVDADADERIKPIWKALEKGSVRECDNVIQLPTLFAAYKHEKMYEKYPDAGTPKAFYTDDLIIDVDYNTNRVLEYMRKLSECNEPVFWWYIKNHSFEFPQLPKERELELKLAIQEYAVFFYRENEEKLIELLEVLRFEYPRRVFPIPVPWRERMLAGIKYCSRYYQNGKGSRKAFFDFMLRLLMKKKDYRAEAENIANEFYEVDFPVPEYAARLGENLDVLAYTMEYIRAAKGKHVYCINPENRKDEKYIKTMFGFLDAEPSFVSSNDALTSDYASLDVRLNSLKFWLEDMETVNCFADASEKGAELQNYIWEKVCATKDSELFALAYKKGFISRQRVALTLENYGNDEKLENGENELIPVMLGVLSRDK